MPLSVLSPNVRLVSTSGTIGTTRPAVEHQHSFDELGDPLRDVTFVVVDLETTGGSSATESITEFGAVKVRGGEVLGEFATLVDPGRSIPPQIVMLTGITDAMVRYNAPTIATVLPSFLEFIRGSVLVARTTRASTSAFSRPPAPGSACPGRATRWWTPSGWRAGYSPERKHRASGWGCWHRCWGHRWHPTTGR